MKPLLPWAVLAILLAITPVAWAAPTSYVLDVQGMKCAFCAYNAVEQLSEVPGVQAPSVHIDLPAQKAYLISETPLARETLARALEQAGFRLIDVQTVPAPQMEHAVEQKTILRLALMTTDVDESDFGSLLKALGATIAERGGRIQLQAPVEMEKQLVKSLLMGKRVAVPVDFEASAPRSDVVIEWQQPAHD